MRTLPKEFNTHLGPLLRVADRLGAARLIPEIVVASRDSIKQTETQWDGADSTAGFDTMADGGVRLTAGNVTPIDKLTGSDGLRTDIDIPLSSASALGLSGDVARIRWGGNEDPNVEISDITLRLHPKRTGAAKEVEDWELHLWAKDQQAGVIRLIELCDPVRVPATGTVEAEYTFSFADRARRPRPKELGPLGTVSNEPTTYIEVRALKAGGNQIAGNVGWARDSTAASFLSGGNTLEGVTLLGAFDENQELYHWQESNFAQTPILRVRFVSVAASATIAFTAGGNQLDLGAVPTGTVEFLAEGETPSGSAITFEVRNDADSAWVPFTDGQTTDDLAGVTKRQTYKVRATLASDASNRISPILRRLGVRELTNRAFPDTFKIRTSGVSADPIDFRVEIEEIQLSILRDGERDFRDPLTEILTANILKNLEVRLWIGLPTWVRDTDLRYRCLLRGVYRVRDWDESDAEITLYCDSPLADLRVALPVYNGVAFDRHPLEYPGSGSLNTLKEVYEDLRDGQVGLPTRYRGPGVTDAVTEVNRVIYENEEVDGKVAMDAIAAIARGVNIESQGRLKFVQIYPANDSSSEGQAIRAIIPMAECRFGPVGPGYSERIPEYFVRFGYDHTKRTDPWAGEYRAYHTNSINNLGFPRVTNDPRLADEICKWIPTTSVGPPPTSSVAESLADRIIQHLGNGFITLPFTTEYPYPELELGDLIAVETDRLVLRHPNTGTAIRGKQWVIGVIVAVDDLLGQAFTIWCRSYSDIVYGTEAARRLGFALPEVLEVALTINSTGAVTGVIKCREAKAVKIAVSTSGFPVRATVQAAGVQALGADGTLATGTLATIDANDVLYVSVLAYENADGSGAESTTMGQAKIDGAASLSPEATAVELSVNHIDGSVKVQVYGNSRTQSYRYAYNVGLDPAWPSDGTVEAGTIRTITGSDAFTLAAGTLTPVQRIKLRIAPYKNTNGTGDGGATDHGFIVARDADRLADVRSPSLPEVLLVTSSWTVDATSALADVTLQLRDTSMGPSTNVTLEVWVNKSSVNNPDPTAAADGSVVVALNGSGLATVDASTSFGGPGNLLDAIRAVNSFRMPKTIYARVTAADGRQSEKIPIALFLRIAGGDQPFTDTGRTKRDYAWQDGLYALVATASDGMTSQDGAGKFVFSLTNRLFSVIDEQGSPQTRVKIGEIAGGAGDWGVQVIDDAGRVVLNGQGSVLQLQESAVSPAAGVNVKGTLPGGWTRYLNLNGSGTFLKHDKLELKYDGTATFGGAIDIADPPLGGSGGYVFLRGAGVAHGMTDFVDTNVLGWVNLNAVLVGGLYIAGFTEQSLALELAGHAGDTTPDVAPVRLTAWKKSGTGRTTIAAAEEAHALYNGATQVGVWYGSGAAKFAGGLVQDFDFTLDNTRGNTADRVRVILQISTRTWHIENDGNADLFKIRDQTAGADRHTIDYSGNHVLSGASVTIDSLAGSGTRAVVADATGALSAP